MECLNEYLNYCIKIIKVRYHEDRIVKFYYQVVPILAPALDLFLPPN